MRHAIIAVLLLAALAGTAVAGPYEDGVSAHDRGDYATALREFRVLAEQGLAEAQQSLAFMYNAGNGVPQDYAEAAKLYRKAAEQGLANSQFNLAFMYFYGYGVPLEHVQAIKWYRMAAEQGHAAAQFHLGLMYEGGRGVPKDYVQAHMWYNLAGARGYEQAAENRDLVAKRVTPAQIVEAQKLAREWKPK